MHNPEIFASKLEFWCLPGFQKSHGLRYLVEFLDGNGKYHLLFSAAVTCVENSTPSCSVFLSIRCMCCFRLPDWCYFYLSQDMTFYKLKNICEYDNKHFLNVSCVPDCCIIRFIFSLQKFQSLAHSFKNIIEDSFHGNIFLQSHSFSP